MGWDSVNELRVRFLAGAISAWCPAIPSVLERFLVVAGEPLREFLGTARAPMRDRLIPWPNQDTRDAALPTQGLQFSCPGNHDGRLWLAYVRLPGEPIAFALWDPGQMALLLLRDALGCIPLCATVDSREGILIGATPDELAQDLGSRARIDLARVGDVLVPDLQWLDLSSTFYRGIQRIPAGCWARIDASGIRIRRYWRPAAMVPSGLHSDQDWSHALLDVLRTAIADCQRDADARWGSMLSGGMDSSAVTAIAAQQALAGEQRFKSISVRDSASPDCVESAAIGQALVLPGLDPELLDLAALDADRSWLQAALFDVEEPWDAGLSLLRWVYAAAARRGCTHVMDGIDADSLFSGFAPANELMRQIRRFQWLGAWKNARGLDLHYYEGRGLLTAKLLGLATWQAVVPGRVRGAFLRVDRPRSPTQQLSDAMQGGAIRRDFALQIDLAGRQALYDQEGQDQGMLDLRGPVAGIERYFRAAKAHGVMPIHPFLDTRVVEFCLGLPQRQKLANGWTKYVLRNALRDLLPDTVRWRRGKQHLGWSLTRTLALALDPPLHLRLRAMIEVLDAYVDPSLLQRLTTAPAANDDDLQWAVNLLALAHWLRKRSHQL